MAFGFDIAALQFAQSFASPVLDSGMKLLTELGSPVLWMLIAALFYWRGKLHESFSLVNLIVFASAISGILKAVVASPRPDAGQFRVLYNAGSYSFPSGHATMIAASAAHFWNKARANWKILLAVLVVLVAYSRMYLGAHFLSDVIAGIAVGALIGIANHKMTRAFEKAEFRLTRLEDELFFVAAIIAGIILLVLFDVPALAAVLIGFYAGFFLLKEIGIKVKECKGMGFIGKSVVGLGVVGLLYFAGSSLSGFLQFILYFIAGFWVSFILPYAYEKFIR